MNHVKNSPHTSESISMATYDGFDEFEQLNCAVDADFLTQVAAYNVSIKIKKTTKKNFIYTPPQAR